MMQCFVGIPGENSKAVPVVCIPSLDVIMCPHRCGSVQLLHGILFYILL